jgi:Acyl-CoA thioesterase N-terminal domain/Acyl-CoA thioesterase C-terminal domain
MESAFYEPAGHETFVATPATTGPWSADAQHGGPPSALAARALELHMPDERQRLARVTVDILRPVPVGKISLRTRTVRPGRRITLAEVVMEADGQEVLHARGWRIEHPAGHVPRVGGGEPTPLPPPGDGLAPDIFTRSEGGYLASIEWRFRPGAPTAGAAGQAGRPGPAMTAVAPGARDGLALSGLAGGAWTRPKIPLLPGEDPSPMARALLVADSGSGVGAALPAREFIFINVDLTVVLPRDPAGEWLLLEPSTMIGSDGTGLTSTKLSDQLGLCGRGFQTLLVAPR